MFDIIPCSEKTYNVVKIAAMLKTTDLIGREVCQFISYWDQCFHCQEFYTFQRTAWGYNNTKLFYITE